MIHRGVSHAQENFHQVNKGAPLFLLSNDYIATNPEVKSYICRTIHNI